jgi:hypothetical protein
VHTLAPDDFVGGDAVKTQRKLRIPFGFSPDWGVQALT